MDVQSIWVVESLSLHVSFHQLVLYRHLLLDDEEALCLEDPFLTSVL